MGARYGDRFRQQPATSTRDVLDLGELDRSGWPPADRDRDGDRADELDLGPAPTRPWYASWAARLALVLTLVVGVAAGAYGWERWRLHEADLATLSAVELVASGLSLNYGDEQDEVSLGVRFRNEGEHEIVVHSVEFEDDRIETITDPDVLTIAAGASERQNFRVQAKCPVTGNALVEPPRLVVETETVDGNIADEVIDSGLGPQFMDWFTYACESQSYQPRFADSYGDIFDVTPSDDGTAVRAMISIGYVEDRTLTISGVETLSDAFDVEYTVGDMSSSTSFGAPPITVVYRVRDCSLAQAAAETDMTITVTGAIEGTPSGDLMVMPTATLAVELVRLAERSCPA